MVNKHFIHYHFYFLIACSPRVRVWRPISCAYWYTPTCKPRNCPAVMNVRFTLELPCRNSLVFSAPRLASGMYCSSYCAEMGARKVVARSWWYEKRAYFWLTWECQLKEITETGVEFFFLPICSMISSFVIIFNLIFEMSTSGWWSTCFLLTHLTTVLDIWPAS